MLNLGMGEGHGRRARRWKWAARWRKALIWGRGRRWKRNLKVIKMKMKINLSYGMQKLIKIAEELKLHHHSFTFLCFLTTHTFHPRWVPSSKRGLGNAQWA